MFFSLLCLLCFAYFNVEDNSMGKIFGLSVKSGYRFFILKFKMASNMAAKMGILQIFHILGVRLQKNVFSFTFSYFGEIRKDN